MELARLAASPESDIPFTDEERETFALFALLRIGRRRSST